MLIQVTLFAGVEQNIRLEHTVWLMACSHRTGTGLGPVQGTGLEE